MNINGYIKQNRDKSYKELPFNDVDGLIFSEMSYINFDLLMGKKKVLKLNDIHRPMMTSEVFEGSVDANKNSLMLRLMRHSVRYGEIKVRYVKRFFDDEEANQFLALTLELPDGTLFISYRGTDTTLIGWKEDAFLTFKDTIRAQEQALDYAKYTLRGRNEKFILGGHSKGGNLAFYTALNLTNDKAANLIKAYSYDGPGFKDGITKYPNYRKVNNKLIKFKTYNDVIGSFFSNLKKYKVVHSPGLLFGGHDPFYWQVIAKNNDFFYAKDVSVSSKKYTKRVMKWVESLTYEDRKLATEALFDVFATNNTIYDLFRHWLKNLMDIKKALKDYTDEERERLKAIIRRFFAFLLNSTKAKDIKKKQAILDRELSPKRKKKVTVKPNEIIE